MDKRKNIGSYSNIDEYIEKFPAEVQEKLKKLRLVIRETAPMVEEKINYGMPTFWLKGNLVHFAAYEKHIGFYPTSSGVAAFLNELDGFKTSKGGIQFPIDQELPWDLIKKIVKFRVEENLKQ